MKICVFYSICFKKENEFHTLVLIFCMTFIERLLEISNKIDCSSTKKLI